MNWNKIRLFERSQGSHKFFILRFTASSPRGLHKKLESFQGSDYQVFYTIISQVPEEEEDREIESRYTLLVLNGYFFFGINL